MKTAVTIIKFTDWSRKHDFNHEPILNSKWIEQLTHTFITPDEATEIREATGEKLQKVLSQYIK